jgi:hypothetical protein
VTPGRPVRRPYASAARAALFSFDCHVNDPAEVGQAVIQAQDMVAVQAEDNVDVVGLDDFDRRVTWRDLPSGGGDDHSEPLLP